MKLELTEVIQALVVEAIRRLWGRGLYRDSKWLVMIHSNWVHVWVHWKTDLAMRRVDAQAEDLVEQWEEQDSSADPIFTEEKEGETPLGGEMRLTARWKPPGGV